MDFEKLFSDLARIKVAVIGDVMLDTYWWGHVERISPEAPVPVVSLDRREYRIGGAGNVALNTVALGAPTSIISVMGDDEDGKLLRKLFHDNHIDTDCLQVSADRITTSKTRVISRNQQMMRLDSEITRDLSESLEQRLLEKVTARFRKDKPDVLIFEDYNKGILTERLIGELISLCREHDVITAADPKRKNFFSYRGVDIFKPNLKEVKEGLNLLSDDIHEGALKEIHTALHEKLQHRVSFITLSERGVFYQMPGRSEVIPSHIRNIADVSGAGDTVIAVAALVYAAAKDMALAAAIANIAGGLVCEEVGTAAIDRKRLMEECGLLLK